MRKIYIHAGTHKTGTTSFQALIRDQRDHLRAHGIKPYLEKHGGHLDANCHALAHALLRAEVVSSMRFAGDYPPPSCVALREAARKVRRFMATTQGQNLLFSAEALSFLRSPAELRALRWIFGVESVELVPIVVFRDPEAWRHSWTTNIGRNPAMSARMGDPDFPMLRDWWFDQDAIRHFWRSAGALREIGYEAAVARDGNILPALLAAIDVPPIPEAREFWINRTDPLKN